MLAHLLDFGYFHVIALKGKNETIITGQFDNPLGLSAALLIVASESREPFQFIDILQPPLYGVNEDKIYQIKPTDLLSFYALQKGLYNRNNAYRDAFYGHLCNRYGFLHAV